MAVAWYLYEMVTQNMFRMHIRKKISSEKEKSNALNGSNNRDCPLPAHPFLGYHLI